MTAAPRSATGGTGRGKGTATAKPATSAARGSRATTAKAPRSAATQASVKPAASRASAKPSESKSAPTRKRIAKAPAKPQLPPIDTIVQAAVASLEDDKAEDVVVLDVASRAAFADRMIIATGLADRQIQAMAAHLEKTLAEHGIRRIRTETSPDWVLLDANDLIVHLFKPEARANYRLEKMWGPDSPPPGEESPDDERVLTAAVAGDLDLEPGDEDEEEDDLSEDAMSDEDWTAFDADGDDEEDEEDEEEEEEDEDLPGSGG
jgi:ribosome silencing factor RsfS/YbeB/iojap